jgi:hypothetical protein
MNAIDELRSIERRADALTAEAQALKRCAVDAREKVEQAVGCLAGQVRDTRDGDLPSEPPAGNLGPKLREVRDLRYPPPYMQPDPEFYRVVADVGGPHEAERMIADLSPPAAWEALRSAAIRKRRETGEPS